MYLLCECVAPGNHLPHTQCFNHFNHQTINDICVEHWQSSKKYIQFAYLCTINKGNRSLGGA